LIADKGYDSDEIVEKAQETGIQPVIPPKKNRKIQREYDKYLYKLRHLVENAFQRLKEWRGIATRYAKNTASFLAAVHIRCIVIWAKLN
jgi:transposase